MSTPAGQPSVLQPSYVCPKCTLKYTDIPVTYQLLKNRKPAKFKHQVLNKERQNNNLTKFQARYLKRMEKSDNYLVTICGFCKKRTYKYFEKPRAKVMKVDDQLKITKSQKKRKRDEFSGLNKEAVLSAKKNLCEQVFRPPAIIVATKFNNKVEKTPNEKNKNNIVKQKALARKRKELLKEDNVPEKQNTSRHSLKMFLKSL